MHMKAIVTTGHGGYERLVWQDVPIPALEPGEVLLQVLAAGVNNTDINTRIGWYDASVHTGTQDAAASGGAVASAGASGHEVADEATGGRAVAVGIASGQRAAADAPQGWSGATPFPLIQGADCCARVAAVAPGGDARLVGQRVLVRPCMRLHGFASLDTVWLGSDMPGAFAQYVKVPAREVFPVRCDWSDVELASMPCAYGTAENMLQRARVAAGEHVLVPGASGGVGSAVVQLARRRGARVSAITSATKRAQVQALGAERVLVREDDVVAALGEGSVDVVVDNVAGAGFGPLLRVLRRGGRYVSSGAIGGPMVTLDMRTLYLKDLTLIGSTAWDEPVFANLVAYIERGEIRPLVAQVFALQQIAQAQRMFLYKTHVGNLVLVPPPLQETAP